MKTIVSTLSNDQKYTVYKALPGGGFAVAGCVLIKGGANVVNKVTLRAPDGGVYTQVSDADYEILVRCPQFNAHVKEGYVYVSQTSEEIAAEKEARKASKNLKKKDASAQLTPEDFTKAGKKAPTAKAEGK